MAKKKATSTKKKGTHGGARKNSGPDKYPAEKRIRTRGGFACNEPLWEAVQEAAERCYNTEGSKQTFVTRWLRAAAEAMLLVKIEPLLLAAHRKGTDLPQYVREKVTGEKATDVSPQGISEEDQKVKYRTSFSCNQVQWNQFNKAAAENYPTDELPKPGRKTDGNFAKWLRTAAEAMLLIDMDTLVLESHKHNTTIPQYVKDKLES